MKVGDEVLSYDERTGQTQYKAVTQTFVKQTAEVLYVTVEGDAKPIGTTREHPFYVQRARTDTSGEGDAGGDGGAWVAAGELGAGDRVRRPSGEWVRVTGIAREQRPATVYNFEVADNHTYFVGARGILVHNQCRNVGGGRATAEKALTNGEKWLGPGYREISPGVFRSADGSRQFRMTTNDLTDPRQGPHVHFESIAPNGRSIIENSHVGITNP